MKAIDRLVKYVGILTPSDEHSDTHPSNPDEFKLAHELVDELKSLGVSDAFVDEHCYVYGHIPATPGKENAPSVGLIAHMDTVSDYCDHTPNVQIIENYDGNDVVLGTSGRILRVNDFPHLPKLKGRTLITSDGTTILGSDDKSGIAEIMTAIEQIDSIPHGPICVAFTPDEEIGRGTDDFRQDVFGANFAFTLDGEVEGEVQYESFNAACAKVTFHGNNVHPGSAKDVMVNASLVAMEFNLMLPVAERPEYTEKYEGFFHLTSMSGSVEKAKLTYLLRDHDKNKFAAKKSTMELAAKHINEKYGEGTVELSIRDQYGNMAAALKDCPELMEIASKACKNCDVDPISVPIRGGTDGAVLSLQGLPCPNLGTGGFAFHGPYEHATVEGMDSMVRVILEILRLIAE
jgi:tripeptide aminopeptidase